MNTFLSNRYRVLESVSEMKQIPKPARPSVPKTHASQDVRPKNVRNFHISTSLSCQLCKEMHPLSLCPEFLRMSVEDRSDIVRKHKFCLNCLAATHFVNKCQSRNTCFRCKGKHHTLLHSGASVGSTSAPTPSIPQTSSSQNIQSTSSGLNVARTHFSANRRPVLLATAWVKLRHHGNDFDLRALIDQGSEVSFISEEFQQRLDLPIQAVQAQISGMSSTITAVSSKLCSFTLCSNLHKDFAINVQALVLQKLTGDLPSYPIDIGDLRSQIDFPLADPFFNQSSKIDMLIGADLYPAIVQDGLKNEVLDSIMAQNTVFGWVLLGPLNLQPVANVTSHSTFLSFFNETSLDKEIEKFWKLEELPEAPMLTMAEQFCEDLYKQSTCRNEEGRYVVKLPFKETFPQELSLGHSRSIAMRQFVSTEVRLGAKPPLKEQYEAVLAEYLDLGHMNPTKPHEVVREDRIQSYYLPHHAVLKPQSSTTKLRVVFNASSSTSNGVSLNDLLYPGPVLQTDITILVMSWRFYRYVFTSDIEKMFRQIRMHPEHTPYQRILFREESNQPVRDYELQTVTFGVKCAPYLAIRTLLQLAKDVELSHPFAASILEKESYVDDILSGAHDVSSALKAQQELISALSSAGFPLRKWTANTPELLGHLPPDHLLNKDFLSIDQDNTTKTLGILWNASSDTFSFSVNSTGFSSSTSKRSVLSAIATLYDPAGWLAPIIVSAKLLMQQIWKDRTGWDECLSSVTEQRWKTFLHNFDDIQMIKIPRWIEYTPWSAVQLHGFCDASEKAYAATIYIRVSRDSSHFSTQLLWAKSKVAPINPVSLPRLELQGAVLLSRMIRVVRDNFKFLSISDFRLWTDSTIVLAWLNKHPSTWKTYVANRTSEISTNVSTIKWNHVSSLDNPADLATRGTTPRELQLNQLWWNGPDWLQESELNWPSVEFSSPEESLLEIKPLKTNIGLVSPGFVTIFERFSSWHKAVRVFSYVFRFLLASRRDPKRSQYNSTTLQVEDISFTKTRLIILTQQHYFCNDYKALSQNMSLHAKSSLLTLNPFLDSQKIMRSHGRLASSTLTYNERFPILLPYQSSFAQLYVSYVHQLSLHGDIQLMTRIIRAEFWIPKLRNLIKKCIRTCKPCTLQRKKLLSQLMGALPVERTSLTLPFTNTGMDFAGPFLIKNYFGRRCRLEKGYACLFVCFATKAIHLEAVSDLSTQAFLAAFIRFVSRRGLPDKVFSDNGTNFVGASTVLLHEFQKALISYPGNMSHDFSRIKWTFIPPGSPHMGGLWEAGIKSFKTHFRKIAGNTKFTFEEFATLLTRIESCLNSRPLSRMSDNPSDILPLTPGHFLRGGPLLMPPEPNEADKNISHINRWNNLKILHQQFSLRWKEEYLKELNKRYKWKFPKRDVEVDDIVVIRHEHLPPNEWRLGRVLKVYRGSNNRVRVADVQTQAGIVTRSIVKLCVLLSE